MPQLCKLDSYQWLRLAVPDLIEAMHKSSQIPRPNAVVELSFEQRTPWRCWWPVNGRWNGQKNWSQQRRRPSKSENLFGIQWQGVELLIDIEIQRFVCFSSSFPLDSHVLLFFSAVSCTCNSILVILSSSATSSWCKLAIKVNHPPSLSKNHPYPPVSLPLPGNVLRNGLHGHIIWKTTHGVLLQQELLRVPTDDAFFGWWVALIYIMSAQ